MSCLFIGKVIMYPIAFFENEFILKGDRYVFYGLGTTSTGQFTVLMIPSSSESNN